MRVRLNTVAIKKLMANQRLNNSELAKICGMSPQNISTIFARGTCYIATAGRIAAALQVDLEEIWKEE